MFEPNLSHLYEEDVDVPVRRIRPSTAKQVASKDLLSFATEKLNTALQQKKTRARPQSAHQGIKKIRELHTRRVEKDKFDPQAQTQGSRSSKQYLKEMEARKREKQLQFEKALVQDWREFERKVQAKVVQANRLCQELKQEKRYEFLGERNGIPTVRLNKRLMSAEVFLREFEKLATPDVMPTKETTGREEPSSRKMNKKDIQDELRNVLKDTIELTETLTEQLTELQRKGWNCSANTTVTFDSHAEILHSS